MPRASIILVAVLAVTVTAREEALAELLSSRPITVIIPFTPGASADTLQRIVGKKVTENTGRRYLTEREVERLMDTARRHSRRGQRNSCARRNRKIQLGYG
jgi:integrase